MFRTTTSTFVKNRFQALVFAFGISSVSGADVFMADSNRSWLNAGSWDNNATPSPDNDYFLDASVGGSMRTSPSGGTSGGEANFLGNSLTVPAGVTLLAKQQDQEVAAINGGAGNLIVNGGVINFGPTNGGRSHFPTLDVNELRITATSGAAVMANAAVNTATIDGELTGPGDLLIEFERDSDVTSDKTILITEVDGIGYTGTITVDEAMILAFGSEVAFTGGGGIELLGTSKLEVSETITLLEGELIDPVNGIVPPGVYSETTLEALGANYRDEGGTIVISNDGSEEASITFENLEVIKTDGVPTEVRVTFSGLESGTAYLLNRNDDLSPFLGILSEVVDNPTVDGSTFTFIDDEPLVGKAFYRLQEGQLP